MDFSLDGVAVRRSYAEHSHSQRSSRSEEESSRRNTHHHQSDVGPSALKKTASDHQLDSGFSDMEAKQHRLHRLESQASRLSKGIATFTDRISSLSGHLSSLNLRPSGVGRVSGLSGRFSAGQAGRSSGYLVKTTGSRNPGRVMRPTSGRNSGRLLRATSGDRTSVLFSEKEKQVRDAAEARNEHEMYSRDSAWISAASNHGTSYLPPLQAEKAREAEIQRIKQQLGERESRIISRNAPQLETRETRRETKRERERRQMELVDDRRIRADEEAQQAKLMAAEARQRARASHSGDAEVQATAKGSPTSTRKSLAQRIIDIEKAALELETEQAAADAELQRRKMALEARKTELAQLALRGLRCRRGIRRVEP